MSMIEIKKIGITKLDQYVFIVAVNNRIVPLASAIDHTDSVS